PFDRRSSKPDVSNARSASLAVHRGSLGIHLDGRGQNLPAQEDITFLGRQRFEVELDRLSDVHEGLFKRTALRLTSLQLRAPGVETALVLFDYDARLAHH